MGVTREALDVPDPDDVVAQRVSSEAPVNLQPKNYGNPTIEQLLSLWQGGSHETVAVRILDALDSYADFLEFASRLGHDGAVELGQIMDTLTAEEKSPHAYDEMPDTDVPVSTTGRPMASDMHSAPGASE